MIDSCPDGGSRGGPVVPSGWQGGLPFTYHVGPGPVRVHLRTADARPSGGGGMKVLQLGVGAIGTVVARHLAGHRAVESLTLGDMDTTRADRLARELKGRVSVERADAADPQALARVIKGHGLVVSAVLPKHNEAIMKATLAAEADLLDLSAGGEDQLAHDAEWRRAGRTAIHGMGEDPGISNVFARWGADRLDEIETIRVRDGEYSTSEEFPLACLFSTETFIEEAVSPATCFENGRWKTMPAFSNREVYPFPEPVGPQVIYNMSHEEVDTLPRYIGKGVRFVDFKLAVPDEMHRALAFLDRIGMTRRDAVRVRGGEVTPLSVLAAVLPQPADPGDPRGARHHHAPRGDGVVGHRVAQPLRPRPTPRAGIRGTEARGPPGCRNVISGSGRLVPGGRLLI